MRKSRFEKSAISHQGAGQICQIFFPEKGQGNFTQPFGQRYPAHAAFQVSDKISAVVLEPSSGQDKQDAGDAARCIPSGAARKTSVQQIAHE